MPTIITPSPMFFTTRALAGSDSSIETDEALDQVERLLLALFLGEAHEADEVREGDRDAQLAEHLALVRSSSDSHVRDHVLLDEVPQEVRCM